MSHPEKNESDIRRILEALRLENVETLYGLFLSLAENAGALGKLAGISEEHALASIEEVKRILGQERVEAIASDMKRLEERLSKGEMPPDGLREPIDEEGQL